MNYSSKIKTGGAGILRGPDCGSACENGCGGTCSNTCVGSCAAKCMSSCDNSLRAWRWIHSVWPRKDLTRQIGYAIRLMFSYPHRIYVQP